ncbi:MULTISPECIES: DUF3054 domain-containing protein [unclassified Microbacterium]|uniref:DUF3054 domain-containing protein n=1 Tax=unclassified Microbacterium TaxID=2609290 RepID=UPI001E29168E|nr:MULTISPECIES: DUF3054 domain-containing protein [unclassified Microbacterium]
MTAPARPMHPALVYTIDLVLVLAFCALGRGTHGEAPIGAGFPATAGPFVVGLVIGWLVNRFALGGHTASLRSGAVAYAATLVGGMLLRMATGQGTAAPFVIVAAFALAALLLGWRLVARAVRRSRRA